LKVRVIINRGGGSFGEDSAEKLQPLFEKNGIEAKILAVEPGELDRHCTEAAQAAGIDALVAAGGDGTISTAAAAVAGTEMPLGVLPLGTLNHFAKDAGIPLALVAAGAAIAGGRTRQVDVAEVNGRVFINNSAVGLYPELVKSREAQQRLFGRGKKLAMLVAGMRAFWRFSRRRLTIRIAGHEGSIVTPLLFVGNNRYKMDLLDLGQRDAIDRGELCLYAPLAGGPFHFLSVSVRAVLGREDRQSDFLAIDGVREVEIDSPRAALMVATDGEAQTLDTPLRYKVRPGALKLIVPIDGEPEQKAPSSRT
jgi:diacylglycerol kinase family enzyme